MRLLGLQYGYGLFEPTGRPHGLLFFEQTSIHFSWYHLLRGERDRLPWAYEPPRRLYSCTTHPLA